MEYRELWRQPDGVRKLRVLTRYRKRQADIRAAGIARLDKVLQVGIKLTSVVPKVLTQSGRDSADIGSRR